ncbi:MAG: aspartate-semialdehyde dehydrogenase [Bacteroidales bacterium]|nr:aspartate-semialdehyde dehydrogenase [Bacteroidales bacterium]MBQ8461439.1 aspartate-semialdehyde dehydrogenase [Bacteroidales bacterium]
MKVAVVGATGLVGEKMLEVLYERRFPVSEIIPVATERSVGKKALFGGKEYTVVNVDEALARRPQLALFSAGATASDELAPRFAAIGCRVVDNSSRWRMDPAVKLIVPEINGHILTGDDYIIANPNCSTIQMVLPLAPLHRRFGIKRIVVSTYQSVTGTGRKAVEELFSERSGKETACEAYPYPIDLNILPHIDSFLEDGYTKEEMKMVNETRKILDAPQIGVSATTVRVPVTGGHSESVNVEFEQPYTLEEVRQILENTEGVVLQDKPQEKLYPMPLYAQGRDEVFVGRLRRDPSAPNALNLWCVADNLRKGAATNAVQIAEIFLN